MRFADLAGENGIYERGKGQAEFSRTGNGQGNTEAAYWFVEDDKMTTERT